MDIARWLEGLGLGQYQHAFRSSDVDVAVLPELTADDLTALGPSSFRHLAHRASSLERRTADLQLKLT